MSLPGPEENWLEKNISKVIIYIALAAIVSSLLVPFAYALYFHNHSISNNPSDWAPFGNYVGGTLGTLLAFFALTVLLLSLEVQRRELKATRDELQKSYWLAKGNNFENTFFKLLELHDQRVNSLSMNSPEFNLTRFGQNITGVQSRSTFTALWRCYLIPLLNNTAFNSPNDNMRHSRLLDFTEERFTNVTESYYNNLLETFQIVSRWHDQETARRYFRILQAQMTSDELRCLYAFACTERYSEMKSIIEEYSFFRSKAMFEIPETALSLYEAAAFGDLADQLLRKEEQE